MSTTGTLKKTSSKGDASADLAGFDGSKGVFVDLDDTINDQPDNEESNSPSKENPTEKTSQPKEASVLTLIMEQMKAMNDQIAKLQVAVHNQQLPTADRQPTMDPVSKLGMVDTSFVPPRPINDTFLSSDNTRNSELGACSLSMLDATESSYRNVHDSTRDSQVVFDSHNANKSNTSFARIREASVGSLGIPQGVPYEYRRIRDLPDFNGRPEDWPMFSTSFHSTTDAYRYSDLENLLRLQKCLSGDARKTVESILIHPRHVRDVLIALEDAFGRPEVLIRSQIRLARQLAPIDESHLEHLGPFAISVRNLATFLDSDATQHHLANPTLLDELIGKLPVSRRIDWARIASQIRPYPTILDFSRWLSETARLVSLVIPTFPQNKPSHSTSTNSRTTVSQSPKTRNVLLNVTEDSVDSDCPQCNYCSKGHDLRSCNDFLRLNAESRLREVARMQLCQSCFQPGHMIPFCTEKQRCNVNSCTLWHSPILHDYIGSQANSVTPSCNEPSKGRRNSWRRNPKGSDQRSETSTESTSSDLVTPVINFVDNQKAEKRLLFRIVPVVLYGQDRQLETFAILDEGSSISLIDADVAKYLNLEGPISNLSIQWFGSQTTVVRSEQVSLKIQGRSIPTSHEIHNVRTISDLKLPTQSVNTKALKSTHQYLRNIPFAGYEQAQPKILIGLDHHHLGVPTQTRTSHGQKGIAAAKTKLGWVVYGSDDYRRNPGAVVLHVHGKGNERYDELSELVRAHFTTEDFGVKLPTSIIESDDDVRARRLLEVTTTRTTDRFQTGLLWKEDHVNLPDSFNMAVRRLSGVETKMSRDPDFAAEYKKIIDSYVQKGYARKLSTHEANLKDSRTWYLPHFAIRNPNKPGKLRLVFDAAAEVRGVSLNSALLTGPDLNIPLTRILFRFRIGLVGVTADIREMYHQVNIQSSDQNSQRFLWRNGDASCPPEVYTMQVMTFGATCSPSSAQYVKNLNAEDFSLTHPEAAKAIQESHYVDDFVSSFATTDEAVKISSEVVYIHKQGGFELRGFVSSHNEVLVALNAEKGSTNPVSLEPKETADKILGMSWDTTSDCFLFETRFSRVSQAIITGLKIPSKREILSVSMSIFDPFGLLSNFTLVAKLILQDLWRQGATWDEPVSQSVNERWQAWRTEIPQTKFVRVPRCYSPSIISSLNLQLHVFADASETAFAAVAYWRVPLHNGIDVAFVAGKARCAPLQILSIPRLELQAAVLATRLMTEIRESHGLHIDRIFMWTDSQTVLQWVGSDQRKFKPFVAFRVAEIVESAPASWWNWVPTDLNVADEATRVKHPVKFDKESRWLLGPQWLRESEENWPRQSSRNFEEQEEEIRSKFVGLINCSIDIDFMRFSKYHRLCRTVAWVRRFMTVTIARYRGLEKQTGELTMVEVNEAITTLCRVVQRQAFPNDYAALLKGPTNGRSSSIASLRIYLDEDQIIRVYGRADAADEEFLPRDAKRPILLPRDHRFTMLLVTHHHSSMAHQLTDATISAVRQKFWVPQLRVLVRSIQAACMVCRIRLAAPLNQTLGQLPADRLTPYVRPFSSTGMDYFGPVAVTVGRRREKRWVALFTCLSIRAVHLEIASDLSTDACLICIRNLCNIRGVPSRIRCDNGTNFVGARNVLSNDGFFEPEAIKQELTTRGIEWVFNCPSNPEAGGAWERLVQSVKRVLRVTLKDEAPRVETLRAHLLEAANILNSRPLTHLPVDPDDSDPITPNHFLIGGPNAATLPIVDDPAPSFSKMQWKICKGLSRQFWRQWVRDYLPELTRRSKDFPNRRPIQIGDLVIICDGGQPRSQWSKGRIVATITGSDGIIRTAEVRTKDALLRRPVSKLAVLDLSLPNDIRGRECRQLPGTSK